MKKHIVTFTLAAATALLASTAAWADFSFSDVQGIEFYFASGVGAWDTHLTIEPDGSFSGNYHDSDMGSTGEGYPNGTIYFCDFTGSFTEPEKVDEYTYTFSLESLNYARTPEEQDIVDEVLYRYSDAYGLEDAEAFYMYLPGKPLAELPEEFLGWVRFHGLSETGETTLPFYGLYNENAQDGFSGYPVEEDYISSRVKDAEADASSLETEVSEGNLPQTQLNLESYELYQIWDQALNDIWAHLKDQLDVEAMDALTQEELTWIANKEADIKKQGSEFEGGSMQPYIENMTAFRWTKERVYELAERY